MVLRSLAEPWEATSPFFETGAYGFLTLVTHRGDMPDARNTREPMVAALDQRAAVLARLLESHPALHLLAEYEAVFLDRRLSVDCRDDGGQASASALLDRMDAAITALEHGAKP